MNLLLDTHTFLWLDSDPARLSPTVQNLCNNPETELLLSVVSIWEMQIKYALGKLSLRLPLRELIEDQKRVNGLTLIPVVDEHAFALDRLPLHHNDPFDRLIIAQALTEGLPLASVDAHVAKYPITVVW